MLRGRGRRELARLRREARGLLNFLCPAVCHLCSALLPHPGQGLLCPGCRAAIKPLPAARCTSCALPFVSSVATPHQCEDCLRQPPPFVGVIAGGLYQDKLQQAIQQFKFAGDLNFDCFLATLIGLALRRTPDLGQIDLVVAVPLHPQRLRDRTYNQAQLLAQSVAERRGWAQNHRLLSRSRLTDPQTGLCREERRRNLAGAFTALQPLAGQSILLVDDVMTTGATVREAAQTLLTAGAARVTVAVAARAPRHPP